MTKPYNKFKTLKLRKMKQGQFRELNHKRRLACGKRYQFEDNFMFCILSHICYFIMLTNPSLWISAMLSCFCSFIFCKNFLLFLSPVVLCFTVSRDFYLFSFTHMYSHARTHIACAHAH